ncbi:hypothetical protein TI03_00565 [Achromatium sp. WMS1]|nr:hypothetical protein TI03_00565 [Achromatium sp. WMS1]
MKYHIIPVTDLLENCTILWCEHTRAAAIVDPGGESERIIESVRQLRVTPVRILLTHGHLDHIGAAGIIAQQLSIPIEGAHINDKPWFEALEQQSRMFGFPIVDNFLPDRWLKHKEQVHFGKQVLEVLHCPGHTAGHVVFFHHQDQLALVGDVIFRNGIGRTDLALGDYNTLMRSIHETLLPLGDQVRFIPGHGPMSDFGRERQYNPNLKHVSISLD